MEENLSSEIEIRRQKIDDLKKWAKFLSKKSSKEVAQLPKHERNLESA